jgi:hypothetical protein
MYRETVYHFESKGCPAVKCMYSITEYTSYDMVKVQCNSTLVQFCKLSFSSVYVTRFGVIVKLRRIISSLPKELNELSGV